MFPRQALAAGLVLVLLAGPSAALSCLRPDIDRMWTRAATSDDAYTIVIGRFDFDATGMPKPGAATDPEQQNPTYLPARFSGQRLTAQGFVTPLEMNVSLELRCLGPWCGSLKPGTKVVAFLRQHTQGWVVEIGPCGGMVWPEPDADILRRLTDCQNGADCGRGG